MRRINKIVALWFLAALLFAMSGRSVHILFEEGHDHDFVCSESATHFHEAEHSCFICEFEFQLSDGSVDSDFNFNSFELINKEPSKEIFFVFSKSHFSFTSRGPPAA